MIYPLAFPNRAPATERLILNRRQSKAESPWTYASSTVDTSAQWVLEWSWPPVTHIKAEALSAWLLSLKGQVGSFRYSPRQAIRSTLTGITLALPGYAYNDTISVKGWAANSGTGLRPGQYFAIGPQLLKIVEVQAFADATGAATITFAPFLRKDYPVGTAVNFATPSGIFQLASADGLDPTLNPDRLLQFGNITAREQV